MIPYIDYSLCVGCGACAELSPRLFVIREGLAWVQNHEDFDQALSSEVVKICTYGAITIEGPGQDKRSHNAPASRGRGGKRGR